MGVAARRTTRVPAPELSLTTYSRTSSGTPVNVNRSCADSGVVQPSLTFTKTYAVAGGNLRPGTQRVSSAVKRALMP